MPDVTLMVQDLTDTEDAERLERSLKRLEFVIEANADTEKGLVAVSYEGGEAEQGRLEQAVEEAGYDFEPSPGAQKLEE
jgi:copper chaperone CopZ